ncbi:hypothetical protein ACVILH_006149 [Bradyrhizobium sp. USDA 4353]
MDGQESQPPYSIPDCAVTIRAGLDFGSTIQGFLPTWLGSMVAVPRVLRGRTLIYLITVGRFTSKSCMEAMFGEAG